MFLPPEESLSLPLSQREREREFPCFSSLWSLPEGGGGRGGGVAGVAPVVGGGKIRLISLAAGVGVC